MLAWCVLQVMLGNGVNPDKGDYDGRTPLHLACASGHRKVVKALMDGGANGHVADRWAREPLEDAIIEGHPMVLPPFENFLLPMALN